MNLSLKNEKLKDSLYILSFIILLPLIGIMIEVIKSYGILFGSYARYIIETNMLP